MTISLATQNTDPQQAPSLALDTLRIFPQIAANSLIGFFRTADIQQYQYFLNMMYHYTLPSGELLAEAAEKTSDEKLKHFFEHQSHEERGHFQLARADMEKGFGAEVTQATPPAIQEYLDFWRGLKEGDALAYLGAIFVFENVAQHAKKDAQAMLDRLKLDKRQSTWLSVHLHADIEHGEEADALVEQYLASDNTGMITYGAAQACSLWVKIFQEAFLPN